MSNSARVLTGLMERRALEAAFAELAETEGLDQLVERARAITQHGSSAVVPVLLAFLDTADPQLRGGLGQVAALLDGDQIIPALRAVARGREHSDQARLTALMILDRFLHQPVDESLLAGLQDPDTVAVQSLRELVHETERNPFVVIEYLNQLAEQPPDVARTVLDVIPRLPGSPHLVTLLRMFAQDEDLDLAQAAIEQLSRTRSPDAAQALHSLGLTLPPPLAALVERGQRKLRMSGFVAPALSAGGAGGHWRALLSPVDGTGAQVIWFVGPPHPDGGAALISILRKDPDGIVASFGSFDVAAEDLPPVQPLGGSYTVKQSNDALPLVLLEVPFDVGRQTVRTALELTWAAGRVAPMEYRLLNPLIWDTGELEAAGPEEEPVLAGEYSAGYTAAQMAALLDHPAMATWYWQTLQVYEAAERLGRRPDLAARTTQVAALITAHFSPELLQSYQRRLHSMARWFMLSAELEPAALAVAAAAHLGRDLPVESLFLRRLVGMGLDVAMANLRSGFDLRRHSAALG